MSKQEFRTVQEHTARTTNGFPMLILGVAVVGYAIWLFIQAIVHEQIGTLIFAFTFAAFVRLI